MSWRDTLVLSAAIGLLLLFVAAIVGREWMARATRWALTGLVAQPLRPLGHIVAYYPLLLPGPLLLFAVCWNLALADLGGFHVLWNPEWLPGVLSGVGVAVVLGATLLATFVLDQIKLTPPTELATDSSAAADGRLPAVRPWAYVALWAAGLVAIAAPAVVPCAFFGGQAGPFRANDFHVWGGLPVFTEARSTDQTAGAETEGELRRIRGEMSGARIWFPLGLALAGAAFVPVGLWVRGGARDGWTQLRVFGWWLLGVFAAHYALMFLAHLAFGRRAAADDWEERAGVRLFLMLLGGGGIALAVWWASFSGPRAAPAGRRRLARWWGKVPRGPQRGPSRGGAVVVGLLVAAAFSLAGWHGTAHCGGTGAPTALIGLLGVLTGGAALISYWSYKRKWWIVLATVGPLTVPFLVPSWQTEYRVPGLEDCYDGDRQFPLDRYGETRAAVRAKKAWPWAEAPGGAPADLLDDHTVTAAAAKRLGPSQRPLVVVAVSGGASASAVYTADILFTLEMQQPGFVDQVRVITGASGGMLGAAYFVAAFLPDAALGKARQLRLNGETSSADYAADVKRAREQALKDLGQDFLSPLVQRYVYLDTPLYFVPRGLKKGVPPFEWGTTNDRGLALEQAWRQMKGLDQSGVLHRPFADLRRHEAEKAVGGQPRPPGLPSLIFAPMMIEDGRQLLISNLDLDYMVDSEFQVPKDEEPKQGAKKVEAKNQPKPSDPNASHTAVEYYRMFPDRAGDTARLRLSTAVRLNASFPFFSPSSALPTVPRRHVVDGGYFDNYGTLTATKWIAHNADTVQRALDRPAGDNDPAQIVLLQVHCFAFESETREWIRKDEESEGKSRPAALHSLVAPFIGALASRRAQMVYRGDERRDVVNRLLEAKGLPRFERLLVECEVGPSLNWTLTPDTRRQLRRDVWEQLEEAPEKGTRRLSGVEALLSRGERPKP